ncbi:MAG: hypothetical protein AAFY24_12870 [Pseudomonadota bacterium]
MKSVKTLAFSTLFALASVTGASASDTISFSVPSGVPQAKGGFKNSAGVVVSSVEVNQQMQNGCDQDDKTHSANVDNGDGFYIYYNPLCDYEFHVKISGCPNQELHMSSADIQSGQTEAHLKGSCADPKLSREVP